MSCTLHTTQWAITEKPAILDGKTSLLTRGGSPGEDQDTTPGHERSLTCCDVRCEKCLVKPAAKVPHEDAPLRGQVTVSPDELFCGYLQLSVQ